MSKQDCSLSPDVRLDLKQLVCEFITRTVTGSHADATRVMEALDEDAPLGTYQLFRNQLRQLQDELNRRGVIRCYGGGLFSTSQSFNDVATIVAGLRERGQVAQA